MTLVSLTVTIATRSLSIHVQKQKGLIEVLITFLSGQPSET